ncbi:hypothetical protein BHM03_00000820 [Ensete ventricosum]|nr:hypothetical protein BHM03_00000820 [Ensete ventricosum]
MRLGTRQECVLSSPRGIGSLPRWRKGVRQKKTETHRKITGGSRKACREHWAKDWTMWRDLTGSSLGDSPRNTSGDCQRKTVRLIAVESGSCRIMGVRS